MNARMWLVEPATVPSVTITCAASALAISMKIIEQTLHLELLLNYLRMESFSALKMRSCKSFVLKRDSGKTLIS
jgi:hypothetical protein